VLPFAITTLHLPQQNNEPFLRQYFGIQCSGFKTIIGLVVHALWPSRKWRHNARLSANPHANVIGPPQCPVVAIITLRRIGEPIAVAAQKICPGCIELRYASAAGDFVDDSGADEIGPLAAEPAGHPDDLSSLVEVLPFSAVSPDPIREDEHITGSPNPDRGDWLATEAVDPNRLDRLARYEVHLDRKLERMLAMLFKLQELRRAANPT
jgi:hypothetical protein